MSDDAVRLPESTATKRKVRARTSYQVIVSTPGEEDTYQEEKSERWAVQAFCELLGEYLTGREIESGTTFFVRRGDLDAVKAMRNAPRNNVIISYTVPRSQRSGS